MRIDTHDLGASYLSDGNLPALLEKFERFVSLPYDDRSQSHNATIGTGMIENLKGSETNSF
jgi:hypothetical protein